MRAVDGFDTWLLHAPAERTRAAVHAAMGAPSNRISTLVDLPIADRHAGRHCPPHVAPAPLKGVTRIPTPNSRLDPFIGYRVALATEAGASVLFACTTTSGRSRVARRARLCRAAATGAAVVYDVAESVSRALGEPFAL